MNCVLHITSAFHERNYISIVETFSIFIRIKEKKIMQDLLNQYLQLLWGAFQYDIDVFSQVWLYAWILIPATGYFIFFILKWCVLTAPFWIPLKMVFGGLKSIFNTKIDKDKKGD